MLISVYMEIKAEVALIFQSIHSFIHSDTQRKKSIVSITYSIFNIQPQSYIPLEKNTKTKPL